MSKNRINLIPKATRPEININYDACILSLFVLCLGFVFIKSFLKYREVSQLNSESSQLMAQEKKLNQSIESIQARQNKSSKTNEARLAIKEVIEKKMEWPEIFKELTYIVPEDLWLNQFKAKNENGQFNLMLKGRAPSHKKTSVFFSSIEKSKYFKDALLNYTERISDISPVQYSFNFATPGFIHEEEQKKKTAKKQNQFSALKLFAPPEKGEAGQSSSSTSIDHEAASKALKSVLSDQLRLDKLNK